MPIIQEFDRQRFVKKHPIYQGKGLVLQNSLPYNSKNSKHAYLQKHGGFIDIGNLIRVGTTAVNFIKDNKDLISSGASAIGGIAGAAKSIADTVKTSKELEQLKVLNEMAKKKKLKKVTENLEMTPEQEDRLRKLGSGFVKI